MSNRIRITEHHPKANLTIDAILIPGFIDNLFIALHFAEYIIYARSSSLNH